MLLFVDSRRMVNIEGTLPNLDDANFKRKSNGIS